MDSMFSPIKKIFTYIQKNASGGTMFGNTNNSVTANEEGVAASSSNGSYSELPEASPKTQLTADHDESAMESCKEDLCSSIEEDDEQFDDIERQLKTSIIDASKMNAGLKAKTLVKPIVLSPNLQLDDELADFAHEPVELSVNGEDDIEEQFLELDNFPNNEIIVLHDTDLNSSIASDNISEDPLAIDDFTQPLVRDSDNVLDSSSVTTNEEVDASTDLLWLKLPPEGEDQVSEEPAAAMTARSSSTPQHAKTKEDELRDGGSDSGMGSETSTLHNTLNNLSDVQHVTPHKTDEPTSPQLKSAKESIQSNELEQASTSQASVEPQKPLRSNLKRRLEDADGMDLGLSSSSTEIIQQKRQKRSINFDNVKIYYFPRQQGFSCVPTAGGCTLGMGARHIAFKTMTLAEHAAELRRAHRNQNQDLQPRGSSSDDSEESEEDYLSEGSGSDADGDSNGFLQPVTPKQRRALLKAAGVRKIDATEKIDCRDIRNSREVCGCSCREFCDPETCACSQAGIKCQVDRAMFPCGCTREACGNTVGRVEFNPTRVRTHYIHTVMRLDMEQRQGQNPSSLSYGSTASPVSHCYFMQTQSNYSSGYASPAYTPDGTVSYYQQQAHGPPTQQQALEQQPGYGSHQDLHTPQYPLDSLDSGLFTSGSNATPSYGELLTPTYHSLSYGSANSASTTQLSPYSTYHQQQQTSANATTYLPQATTSTGPTGAYSSCAVPSAPPYGNATTTASAAQYHHTIVLETTASMTSTTTFLATAPAATATCAFSSANRHTAVASTASAVSAAEFISLSTPNASSSRLSQINDLLQHNRNTTAALVAVSESPGSTMAYDAVRSIAGTSKNVHTEKDNSTSLGSIDTPPIEDAQRSCIAFEELPPPLVNPTPIVAVVEHNAKLATPDAQLQLPPAAPQPRQPLDVSASGDSSSAAKAL